MRLLKPISIFTLVSLVLLSSSNFMVGIHVCSGEIRNVAFLTKAKACEKEQSLPPCHRHTPPCCEDEAIVHEGDELKGAVSPVQLAASPATDMPPLEVIVAEVVPSWSLSRAPFFLYDPPEPSLDITISNQVLLI